MANTDSTDHYDHIVMQLPTSPTSHYDTIKLDDVSNSLPRKSRSERSISFAGISNGQPEDKEIVAEISMSFDNHVKDENHVDVEDDNHVDVKVDNHVDVKDQ